MILKNQQFLYTNTNLILSIFGIIFLVSVLYNLVKDDGSQNLHYLQAESFTHGELAIHDKVNDVSIFEDQYYVSFPPFPAVVLTPFAFIFPAVNTTLIALLITVALILVMRSLFFRLEVDSRISWWLIGAFICGTAYWFNVKFSFGVWSFAHVVAVIMLFLAIRETIGKGRGYLVGLLLGGAFLSRQLAIYSAVFIIFVFIDQAGGINKKSILNIFLFGFTFSLVAACYLYLNYVRFHNPFDTGYNYIAGDPLNLLGDKRYGLFDIHYVPFNMIYMFLQGPHVEFDGLKAVNMDFYGTAITFASPFVFSAFWAKGKRLWIIGAWITISLCMIHMMLYCNNGFVQVNTQRFTLDFLPVLMVLIALSVNYVNKKVLLLSLFYSMLINLVPYILIPVLTRVN